MRLDEHDSKLLLRQSGVPIEEGVLLEPGDRTARPAAGPPWVLKALVRCGGRGKAGGVKMIASEDQLGPALDRMFAMAIQGDPVLRARLEAADDVEREMYLSCALSRKRGRVLLPAGAAGGVDVEAGGRGDLLVQELPSPAYPEDHQLRAAFFHLGLPRELFADFMALAANLVAAVRDNSLLLAEINPLALTRQGQLAVLDAKVETDDNSPGQARLDVDLTGEPEDERRAREAGLSYVHLDGFVGALVNGAGLAMATMDLLTAAGLAPANFLDVGGGADTGRIRTAFDILFREDRVKAVFVNLFGGILSCDKVASAMAEALDGAPPPKPMVVRMSGNGGPAGRKILQDLGQANIHLASEMDAALGLLHALTPAEKPQKSFSDDNPAFAALAWSDHPVRKKPHAFPQLGSTPVLVQGITGRAGRLHTRLMLEYGTNIVAGVTPFKSGERVEGVPVYDSVEQALREHRVEASIIFAPAAFAKDAILEATANDIPWAVCITEGIPQLDMIDVLQRLRDAPTRLIGPNTPGIITPGGAKIGIMPTTPFTPGPVAIISRSGTLTYEAANRLSKAGMGQSICLGVGGDPFIGTTMADALDLLADHESTRAVLMLGEIGGSAEEEAAQRLRSGRFIKPVVGFIAGRSAPPGRRFGHAGAILDEHGPGVGAKLEIMRQAGITSCDTLADLPDLVKSVL